MVKGRLKATNILLILAVFGAIWNIWGYPLTGIHNVTTYSNTVLILFWVYSLRDEIPDTYVRRLMSLGGYLLTLLFILRYIKLDLVIMDIVMQKGAGGLAAARKIKDIRPETKILIVTSMPEVSYIDKAKSIGVENMYPLTIRISFM